MEIYMRRFALSLLLAASALSLSACDKTDKAGGGQALQKVAAPAGKVWSQVVTKTPDEGFLMGNPDAPIKLVEYGSLVCHVCADFSKNADEPMKKEFIDSGQVSFEFRNFLLQNIADVMASAIVHCKGPETFFPLKEAFFASQEEIFANMKTADQAAAKAAEALPPEKRFIEFARIIKITDWFKAHGVSDSEINACLSNVSNLEAREKATTAAAKKYTITGTPTFLLNGEVLENNTWPFLQEKFKELGAK
jgi:protein-disulfide isomerase